MMRWGFVVLTLAVSVGCASTGGEVVVSSSEVPRSSVVEEEMLAPTEALHGKSAAPEAVDAGEAADKDVPKLVYRIGPGDVLELHSFDDETLNSRVTVRYDGFVSLPQVPDLKLVGLTREEAIGQIREAYGAIYAEPQISLVVSEVNSKTFSVMGDVTRPGEHPYTRPLSLLDALTAAGGVRVYQRGGDAYVSAQGQLVKAFVIRHISGDRQVIECDLRGLEQPGSHAADTLIVPGDVVYVPDSVNLVYVLGEVGRPNVVSLTAGMTLLQLLATAGGFEESSARLRQVVLMREIDEETTRLMLINVRRILTAGGDIPLEPGDVVYVPRKLLVRLQTFVDQFTGSISPVVDLYRDAYEAYYAPERLDRTIDSLKRQYRYYELSQYDYLFR